MDGKKLLVLNGISRTFQKLFNSEMEAMEKAKKEKEAQQTTPDYAAGLITPAIPVLHYISICLCLGFFFSIILSVIIA